MSCTVVTAPGAAVVGRKLVSSADRIDGILTDLFSLSCKFSSEWCNCAARFQAPEGSGVLCDRVRH